MAAAAAALAAARRAAAAALSGELLPVALVPVCRGLVGLIAGTGPAAAEALGRLGAKLGRSSWRNDLFFWVDQYGCFASR